MKPHRDPLNMLKTHVMMYTDLGALGKAAAVILRNLNALKRYLFGDI